MNSILKLGHRNAIIISINILWHFKGVLRLKDLIVVVGDEKYNKIKISKME